ncbi:LysM peptidoglycan-binding domain-containing protein [Terriglobus albidus]|uniref:LysM peptidoglycan-binding domain-containing protein n=2 Tax=Terriglobus albidus TaxID=1592106 RepID=A0A5B9EL31_9BACT|nr:LysM peptidoglycan-binding domain-containing protein [Terriglobus albidus]
MPTRFGKVLLGLACTPVVFLTGCPQQQPVKAPTPQAPPTITATPVQQPAASQVPDYAARAQATRVQQLITQVDRSYNSGLQNYRAGRLDAARMDFDASVDMMLTSGLDIRSIQQLNDEFERVVTAVNALELDALKQGTGFSPKLEAAPLDAANDVTFSPDPELTARLNAELRTTVSDFPLAVNDYVAGFINYFTKSPGGHVHLLRSLERAGKYKDMIQKILREEGVPQDLIYLAVAESGFQPQALNGKSGAGGMWQFMPFAGAYGLTRNGWVDERFDPEKSSRAYARYIKELYNQFGDWYLALAAYDWGPGNVQRAVMRTGYADFWELYRRGNLPGETRNYVPGIIAAIIMAKNPQQYNLTEINPEPPAVYDTVPVGSQVDLRLVADVTNSSVATLVSLNPSLLRLVTPRDMTFDLHIPAGTKDEFQKRISAIPEDKRVSWRFHEVRGGETLSSIAESFHVHASEIASVNDIADGSALDLGDELVIPVAPVNTTSASGAVHIQRYTIRKGDTLITVADRFGVSVEQLRRWNALRSSHVSAGKSLIVSEPVRLAPQGRGARKKSSSAKASTSAKSSSKKTVTASKKPSSSSAKRRR